VSRRRLRPRAVRDRTDLGSPDRARRVRDPNAGRRRGGRRHPRSRRWIAPWVDGGSVARSGSMTRMRHLPLVFALLGAGCSERVNVTVHCITVAGPAVECEVKQTQGKAEAEVCWDFTATCENGAVVKAARTCQK